MSNVVVSLSGGKDSVYALYTALKRRIKRNSPDVHNDWRQGALRKQIDA